MYIKIGLLKIGELILLDKYTKHAEIKHTIGAATEKYVYVVIRLKKFGTKKVKIKSVSNIGIGKKF